MLLHESVRVLFVDKFQLLHMFQHSFRKCIKFFLSKINAIKNGGNKHYVWYMCGRRSLLKKASKIFFFCQLQDMTSRDLLQQRITEVNGDTAWRLSPLVKAALEGSIALLDGLHRVNPSTLTVLHRSVFRWCHCHLWFELYCKGFGNRYLPFQFKKWFKPLEK